MISSVVQAVQPPVVGAEREGMSWTPTEKREGKRKRASAPGSRSSESRAERLERMERM